MNIHSAPVAALLVGSIISGLKTRCVVMLHIQLIVPGFWSTAGLHHDNHDDSTRHSTCEYMI